MKHTATILVCAALLLAVPLLTAAPPVKDGFITTSDGVRLHYLESGSGPTIVFVPGWTLPAEIWEHQIRHFAKSYRVIALDPRSQGKSQQTTEGHYPERRAKDIKELVDQLNLAPAVLVGWSLGVAEVLTYVDQFGTDTLRAVVLVDGYLSIDPSPEFRAGMANFLQSIQVNRKQFAGQFVRSMYKTQQPEDYLERMTAASLQTPTNTAVTLVANWQAARDWRLALDKLDRPILYAVTAELKGQGEMLEKEFPLAQVELFEEAGHALFVDEPDRFNALLEDFLNKVLAR